MIKAVFFDAGHTLLYAHPDLGSIYTETTRSFGVEIGPAAFAGLGAWTARHAYALNSYVGPTLALTNTGFYMQATSVSGTGTSGGSEPAWPTTLGGTVIDNPGANQIVWTAVGRNGWLPLKGATLDSYYAGGAPQVLEADFLGLS